MDDIAVRCRTRSPHGVTSSNADEEAGKSSEIGAILDDLYPLPPIPLEHRDPFTLLVAVVLSAQTTDAQVNKVTPALFARARDAASRWRR